jgi:glycosyltransferase involved in cell wall biosynthesis
MLELMVRYVYKLSSHVLAVSEGLAKQIRIRLNHPISFIHNPIRFSQRKESKIQSRKKIGLSPNAAMILAVGRICAPKNYLMLLKAFNETNPSEDHHLYIVGGVYESAEKLILDQFVLEENLIQQVHFVDFTNNVDIYYESADLFVLSSAWEGFGNVLVEALSFGLPIISSRCNYGPEEILGNGKFGVLVEVNDYIAMSKAILAILEKNVFDPPLQIARSKSFSEESVGESYLKLISEITGKTYERAD